MIVTRREGEEFKRPVYLPLTPGKRMKYRVFKKRVNRMIWVQDKYGTTDTWPMPSDNQVRAMFRAFKVYADALFRLQGNKNLARWQEYRKGQTK
jgi:hypothetical protein